ncbi:hypothetical protein [Herbaspirillum sp. YR522]|uniref:hypothetical protein n=1 Tax=Herbaspirillum sp. YR522 TaxID=1144342 RepID=UPI00026FA2A2|nr:hypothetical protein [Herbaspirillum sp. YR522]EJN06468.1 hypothetical protein PMI40_02254 [Herbaspirillum sp. YR522]
MANQWFRLYSEFATDAKVQSMPEAMQRRLIMLFCLRCSDVTVTLSDEELAFQLRISDVELVDTKALFIKKGFIDDAWEVLNWEKRQFASDSSAERTRAWRERRKQGKNHTVTSHEQNGDSLDTDSDTEQKQKKKTSVAAEPLDPDFETAWSEYPRRPGASKAASLKAWNARIRAGASAAEMIAGVKRYATYVELERTEPRFIKQPATFFGPDEHYRSDWTARPRASPPGGTGGLSRQEQLEQRNLAVAARLAGETA